MNKLEYLKLKEDVIKRLGKPEYDLGEPKNEAAREVNKLKSAFKSAQMRDKHREKKEEALNKEEQIEVVKRTEYRTAVPIDLTETDLQMFSEDERSVVVDFFHNTNLAPSELARTSFSTQKVVALMRSGPFKILYDRIFEHLMPMEVRNAALKAVRGGDKKLIERFAEQYKILNQQEQTININKPLENPELIQKLKQLGDSL